MSQSGPLSDTAGLTDSNKKLINRNQDTIFGGEGKGVYLSSLIHLPVCIFQLEMPELMVSSLVVCRIHAAA